MALILVAIISLPSILKIKHALTEHQSFVCKEKGKFHIHEVELDCRFDDFSITTQIFPENQEVHILTLVWETEKIENLYNFLNKYQKLHFSRRGPPNRFKV
jgi:hypothetical protein